MESSIKEFCMNKISVLIFSLFYISCLTGMNKNNIPKEKPFIGTPEAFIEKRKNFLQDLLTIKMYGKSVNQQPTIIEKIKSAL